MTELPTLPILPRLPYCWSISRYEPELRERETPWQSWTDRCDVGESFNGIVLTEEEYLRVENTYVAAAIRFAIDVSATVLRVEFGTHQKNKFELSQDQLVVRSDIAPIVRGNLRGELDCALESADGSLQIAFGYDMYMYVGSTMPCEQALADTVRDGLWVRPFDSLWLWDEDLYGRDAYYAPLDEDEEASDEDQLESQG